MRGTGWHSSSNDAGSCLTMSQDQLAHSKTRNPTSFLYYYMIRLWVSDPSSFNPEPTATVLAIVTRAGSGTGNTGSGAGAACIDQRAASGTSTTPHQCQRRG